MSAPLKLVALCALAATACGGSSGGASAQSNDAPDASAAMGSPDAAPADGGDAGPIAVTAFTMDTPNVVRRANIVLGQPNVAPKDSMALGNGTLGIAAWAANGFTAQLNRADTFPDRKAVGQLVIPGLAAMTGAADFAGHVDLYDAMLVESGGGVTATVYVRADTSEVVIDVTGADPATTQTVRMGLWTGRSPAGLAANGVATLAETWTDTSGLGASGATFGILSGIAVGGRNATASIVDPLTVQVAFQPNTDGSFRIVVTAPSWTGGDAMSTAIAALGSDATAASATLRAGHLAWWHDYWSRVGLVEMTSPDGAADYLEALRTNYLYLTAAESRSRFPSSQAGLADLFDFLQDTQPWFPAGFWVWNLRMQIAANMTSGAFDMNIPVFDLYESNVASIEAWTSSKMGGRSGICLPETMRFNGNGYWYGGEDNASCDQTTTPSYNSLTLTSGAEIALWVWQQYLMTNDRAFLTTNYPLMTDAARFLLAYATTGSDGLLHTVANSHETQWNVQDPITDIVAMQALFQAVVAAAGVLGTDATLIAELQSALTKLPPMPRTDAATHMQLLTAADDAAGQDVFALSYEPSAEKHNGENLDLEAVWPYGLIGDTGASTALAKRTCTPAGCSWAARRLERRRHRCRAARPRVGRRDRSDVVDGDVPIVREWIGAPVGRGERWLERPVRRAARNRDHGVERVASTRLRRDFAHRSPRGRRGGTPRELSSSKAGVRKVDVQVRSAVQRRRRMIVEVGSSGAMTSTQSVGGAVGDRDRRRVELYRRRGDDRRHVFTLPTVAGRWYAIVPTASAAALPNVHVTGTPATAKKTLGAANLGL